MMKLYYSKTSPFARKVLVTAMELGLDNQITLEVAHPLRNSDVVSKANPLGKVPCLIMADGELVVDSPVICQRLIRMAQGKQNLLSSAASSIDDVERIHALADGIMEAAVALVMESLRPAEQQSPMWQERWQHAVSKSVAYIESHEMQKLQDATLTLGHIALACALGYLDFRLPVVAWRDDNQKIASWYQSVMGRPSLDQTVPKD
jgi:glutathione S-transferase